MHRSVIRLASGVLLATSVSASDLASAGPSVAKLRETVAATERAFAATMAARDHAAFVEFLDPDTIFFTSNDTPLRGRDAVATRWAGFFEGDQAPFSWEPSVVEVRAGGELALSAGPVHGPDGKQIGTFQSIWQRQPDGNWKIIFDRGGPHCESASTGL